MGMLRKTSSMFFRVSRYLRAQTIEQILSYFNN